MVSASTFGRRSKPSPSSTSAPELARHSRPTSDLKQAFERYKERPKEEQELFRRYAATFVTVYDFVSQIVDYDVAELKRLRAFLKMLLPHFCGQDDDPVTIDGSVCLAAYKLVNTQSFPTRYEPEAGREIPMGSEPGKQLRSLIWALWRTGP